MTLRDIDIKVAVELLDWKWVDGKLLPPDGELKNPGEWVDGVPERLPRFTSVNNSAIALLQLVSRKVKAEGAVKVDKIGDKISCTVDFGEKKYTMKTATFALSMTLCCFAIDGIKIDLEDLFHGD